MPCVATVPSVIRDSRSRIPTAGDVSSGRLDFAMTTGELTHPNKDPQRAGIFNIVTRPHVARIVVQGHSVVIVLEPGLVVFKIYNGYWFVGRPAN